MGTRIIKCPECGTFNKNLDYCEFCNTLISHKKKIQLKEVNVKQIEVEKAIYKMENPNFAKRLKTHPNIFYKIFGWIIYSVISVVSIIGGALAWFITMVAAG